jgi:hypothetical protein
VWFTDNHDKGVRGRSGAEPPHDGGDGERGDERDSERHSERHAG